MKPSEFQKTIQCQFDCLAKQVVKGIIRDYQKGLKKRSKREIPFCELPDIAIEQLSAYDSLYADINSFDVCDFEIRVLDAQLFNALKKLPVKKRNILLMFYFLGMSDKEIADCLSIDRATSYRNRIGSLEKMKKILEEN